MPNLDPLFFYSFATFTLAGALGTVMLRNAVYAALSLTVSLLGVAGIYLLQQAEFLFVVQIILYIGGIVVLFLFVIMLVNLEEASRQKQFNRKWWLGLGAMAIAFAQVAYVTAQRQIGLPWTHPAQAMPGPNTQTIADVLFSEYLLPFEVASILLLVGMVGSVFMAQRKTPE